MRVTEMTILTKLQMSRTYNWYKKLKTVLHVFIVLISLFQIYALPILYLHTYSNSTCKIAIWLQFNISVAKHNTNVIIKIIIYETKLKQHILGNALNACFT